MQLGRTVAELERSMSAYEYKHWLAFYHHIEPFGEQRADMRHAALSRLTLMPHTRQHLDARDFMLFPDDAHEIDEELTPEERELMLKMNRMGG